MSTSKLNPDIPRRGPQDDPAPARQDGPYLPPGPALLYVYSDAGAFADERIVAQVDRSVPTEGGPMSPMEARRERRLLRALLEQALELLDSVDYRDQS